MFFDFAKRDFARSHARVLFSAQFSQKLQIQMLETWAMKTTRTIQRKARSDAYEYQLHGFKLQQMHGA